MNDKRILFVQQTRALPLAVSDALSLAGYQVLAVRGDELALAVLDKQRFDVVIAFGEDESCGGSRVERLLDAINTSAQDLPLILLGASSRLARRIERATTSSLARLDEPVTPEVLLQCLDQVLQRAPQGQASDFVARDPASAELLALARRVAATDVAVLISGESGTGKEMLARYVHQRSVRANGPFVAINCAAIPENMLEALLFGHEKGAFTGAHQASAGKFEQAQGGVLLLDEISEMALALQAKLLRVLQEREVERLGGRKTIPLDVRVLATTNRALRDEVRAGRFREDLYYRINVFPLQLRPLRARRGDIEALAERLIARHTVAGGRTPGLSRAALDALSTYHWPGNVRELENIVQRALVLCDGATIEAADLHFETHPQENALETPDTLGADLKTRECDLILKALSDGNGSRKFAADSLGISPRTLRYKLARMRDAGIAIPSSERAANT